VIDLGVILLLALLVIAILGAMSMWSRRRPAGPRSSGPGARCGACGYDTTGLTSGLTCPECGSDLRRVGITRQLVSNAFTRFATSAVAFLIAWLLCGAVLSAVVEEVLPRRRHFKQDTGLSVPASRAYGAINVVAEGDGWGERPIPVRVRIELRQLMSAAGPPLPATLPPPLFVDVPTGAYQFTDASGQSVNKPNGFGPEALLAWLSAAGIDAGDARVRDEARLAWLYALRAGRRPRPAASVSGGTGGSSSTTGMGGPFNDVRVAEIANVDTNRWGLTAFFALWVVALLAGLVYLWRQTAGRRTGEQPAGAVGAML
jgi:hypothetical protein